MEAITGARRAGKRLATLAAAISATAGLASCGGGSHPAPREPSAPTAPAQFGASVIRVPGLSPADVAAAAVLAAYPPGGSARPNGWVLTTPEDWQQALLAAQFGARPVNAGLLLTNKGYVATPSQDVMGRVTAGTFPRSGGVQTLLFGSLGQDVLLFLTKLKLRVAQLLAPNRDALGLKLVPFRGGFAKSFSSDIVVVSSQARDYALPAGAWSAYSGDTIAFVNRDSVPAAAVTLLAQRQKLLAAKPAIYIVGPTSVVSSAVEAQLGAYGTVKRIAGPTAIDTAIAFARYRDPATGFGWGLTRGPASVSLLDTANWANAVGAFDLAATGPQAPLLLTPGPGPLPAALVQYLRELRSTTGGSQGYVLGDTRSISSATLHQLDGLLSTGR
jgi:putative cell wall binding repeat protein